MSEDIHGHGQDHMSAYEMRLVKRAVANGWPIPAERRKTIAEKALNLAEKIDPGYDPKHFIGAAGLVLKMDEINVKREAMDQRDRHHAEGEKLSVTGTLSVTEMTDEQLAEIASGGCRRVTEEKAIENEPS